MAFVGAMLAALITVVAAMEDCHDETCHSPQFLQLQQQVRARAQEVTHPWPHARGRMPQQYGTTPETWTSHKLSWSFSDPDGQFHNMFSGGAVIDEDENLYQMTYKGLYAFNLSGHQRWHYPTPGLSNNEPALYGDLVLGSAHSSGNAFAVNRSTGHAVWITKIAQDLGAGCGYPAAYDGVFVVGGGKGHGAIEGGNVAVFGLDVNTGEKLWQYAVDKPVWNLTPLFPGDGSTVFMDFAGGVYKLNLHTGEEIWKNLVKDARESFSDGGATLGARPVPALSFVAGAPTGRPAQMGCGAFSPGRQVSDEGRLQGGRMRPGQSSSVLVAPATVTSPARHVQMWREESQPRTVQTALVSGHHQTLGSPAELDRSRRNITVASRINVSASTGNIAAGSFTARPMELEKDDVHEAVVRFAATASLKFPLARMSKGVYNYGNKKLIVTTHNSKLMVRTGGGFATLEHMIAEADKAEKALQTKFPLGPQLVVNARRMSQKF